MSRFRLWVINFHFIKFIYGDLISMEHIRYKVYKFNMSTEKRVFIVKATSPLEVLGYFFSICCHTYLQSVQKMLLLYINSRFLGKTHPKSIECFLSSIVWLSCTWFKFQLSFNVVRFSCIICFIRLQKMFSLYLAVAHFK